MTADPKTTAPRHIVGATSVQSCVTLAELTIALVRAEGRTIQWSETDVRQASRCGAEISTETGGYR
jgi:hypothetical protein